MKDNKKSKDCNWMILFFLFVGAVARWFMNLYDFQYVDFFIAIVNLIGLDYTTTVIIDSIYEKITHIIDKSNILSQAKTNKKKKQKSFVYIIILILVIYNIIHLIFLSSSVFNDMLSMIVLGLSLTDDSIIFFVVKHKKI
ncbi:MAG: hypothetical protein IJE43_01580 [Alphaproteobacteria bacterium]|nr:hypothetical protein [Alphaproteobacteria bacterium]